MEGEPVGVIVGEISNEEQWSINRRYALVMLLTQNWRRFRIRNKGLEKEQGKKTTLDKQGKSLATQCRIGVFGYTNRAER
jgi:hypothetical protein